MLQIPIINLSINDLPKYATTQSAGADIRADILSINNDYLFNCELVATEDGTIDHLTINPGGRALIPSGLHCKIPEGYEIQIRPRSGLALKHGITCLNTPGTIDSDYTGDIGVILINHGMVPFDVYQGERIAQMIVSKYEQAEWVITDSLETTERGSGGFGHSGTN